MIGYILLGILFLIVIIGVAIYYALNPKSPAELLVTGPFQLNTPTQFVSSDAFATPSSATYFLTEGKATFQAYIYLDSLLKTGAAADCGTRPNQPSCSSGLYDPCKCTTEYDCTNCVHSGYKKLVSLFGVYTLEVLNVPDASRQRSVSAQLVVRTKSANSSSFESYVETIPLPPFPIQKWVLLTIAKDTRQINVYYNNSIVSASKTINMPQRANVSGKIVEGGEDGLSGSIGLFRILPQRLTLPQIADYYSESSDTRGAPTAFNVEVTEYNNRINTAKSNTFISSLCLDLSCFKLPRIKPPTFDINIGKGSQPALDQVSNIYDVNTQYS